MAIGTHAILEESERMALPGAKALGPTNTNSVVEVTLKLRRKKPLPELNGRPATSMTREEMGATYGASQEDIDTVVKTFKGYGLTCTKSDAGTRSVELSGNVAAMEKAFGVQLFNYDHPDGAYRGRVGYVQIPAELKGIVEGVFGLDNRRVLRRRRHPTHNAGAAKALTSIPSAWYKPAELAKHYQFPAGDGAGQCVGIFEFGGGYFADDLQKFCTLANVSMPEVQAVSVDGISTSAKDGAEGEVMLDVEVVAGVCPKASIVMYFAQFTEKGWIAALDAVMQDQKNNPTVISVSWGFAEHKLIWTQQAIQQTNQSLLEAAHMGVTVCVAAGDDGSSDSIKDGHAYADFPSSSPYVIAVGGTTIPTKGGSGADIVWFEGDGLRDDNGGSTGGGVSAMIPRPSWQAGVTISSVNRGSIAGRCVPDVAANADWDASPYLLVVDGKAEGNGGTSAATPLVASLIALINAQLPKGKRAGYLTPVLYQDAKGGTGTPTVGSMTCTDIVSGNNTTAKAGGYSAGVGYDAVSGWGTPIGVKLLAAVQALP